MTRYFTYSSIIHILILLGILLRSFNTPTKKYYTIDFLGGGASGSSAVLTPPAVQKTEPEKIETINPKEDLLIKSKKRNKAGKQMVQTAVPAIPSFPIPKSNSKAGSAVPLSSVPAVPSKGAGTESGIDNIGFGSGGSTAGNFPYTWYVHTLKKKLDANWNVTTGFNAKIYSQVAFTIMRNGSLNAIKIEESSGNDVFDRAALRAVEASSPLPPLPSDFPESELRVHVRFTVKQ